MIKYYTYEKTIFVFDTENGRVRVAVRLRPRTAEDLVTEADFADCVEIQPEVTGNNY